MQQDNVSDHFIESFKKDDSVSNSAIIEYYAERAVSKFNLFSEEIKNNVKAKECFAEQVLSLIINK
jgi:uncharacterized protein (UPF0262 family)